MAAYTQEQYDKLKSAYAQGVLTVEYADQKVTYRSRSDMRQILNEMEAELGIKKRWNGRVLSKYSNGLK